ncbi:hypothetical protein MCP1_780002 [Candidatus Terasakiella magnetica]|nr:hypothetical protein MCP1_780002 [Candidatus Terasakiella magnetica]
MGWKGAGGWLILSQDRQVNFSLTVCTTFHWAGTGGVASGQGVIVGALFGIAATNALEAANVEIATTGVYDLPKAPATVFALATGWRGTTAPR